VGNYLFGWRTLEDRLYFNGNWVTYLGNYLFAYIDFCLGSYLWNYLEIERYDLEWDLNSFSILCIYIFLAIY